VAQSVLPERLEAADGLVLRRWIVDDAEALSRAVSESLEQLRPWMPWVSSEPLAPDGRKALIAEWENEWRGGGDIYMGAFLDGRIAGGCGLHHRIGPGGLEIGYWTHPEFLRRGVATTAARLLTGAALAFPGISHVEIRHDKMNSASGGVPRKLGYRFIGEIPHEPVAPAEAGVSYRWLMTATEWTD
jgi:ribosomal-protein-serine acetyltransferase